MFFWLRKPLSSRRQIQAGKYFTLMPQPIDFIFLIPCGMRIALNWCGSSEQ